MINQDLAEGRAYESIRLAASLARAGNRLGGNARRYMRSAAAKMLLGSYKSTGHYAWSAWKSFKGE